MKLQNHRAVGLVQRMEIGELLGFETRNKYEIHDEKGTVIGFAAEQQKGILGLTLRYFLGHWRRFNVLFFDAQRNLILEATHPFRFFFQRLEIKNAQGFFLGAIQQRFSIFYKKFDLENSNGDVIMSVRSPLWRLWTFLFFKEAREVAAIRKKWSGALFELFTDKDNFLVEFIDASLNETERCLILTAGVFIDLQYFEGNEGVGGTGFFD